MAEKSLKECLEEARALLARPKGWTRGGWGRDAKGQLVDGLDVDAGLAVSYCILGAVRRTCGYAEPFARARTILQICVQKQRGAADDTPASYNDRPQRKKSQILKVMDCAIKAAENVESTFKR
jgi:hypothetical protein